MQQIVPAGPESRRKFIAAGGGNTNGEKTEIHRSTGTATMGPAAHRAQALLADANNDDEVEAELRADLLELMKSLPL